MADPQDQPDGEPTADSSPPDKRQPAKKAPAKKAPAKKAVAKTAPAKKAPAKKVPAEKAVPAPPKAAEPPAERPVVRPTDPQPVLQQRAETNGQLAAAKDVAAQAKSTVESAKDPLPPASPEPSALQSPVVWVVAATLSLLATLLIRQLRRR